MIITKLTSDNKLTQACLHKLINKKIYDISLHIQNELSDIDLSDEILEQIYDAFTNTLKDTWRIEK